MRKSLAVPLAVYKSSFHVVVVVVDVVNIVVVVVVVIAVIYAQVFHG